MSAFDLDSVRRRLREGGPRYWRCLEELADAPEFQELLRREFPREAALRSEGMERREFVMLLGASLALAGLAGCTREPAEKIVPFVRQPEGVVPGKPLYYATAMPDPDGAVGLLVKTVMGRPVKVEGNPKHPASLGAADRFAQASVLSLYDPDRSQSVLQTGRPSPWSAFLAAIAAAKSKDGAGMRILTETVVSPTLAAQLKTLLDRWPKARWHRYEPVGRESVRRGARMIFGEEVEPRYHLDRADVVVSLDADFLDCGPGHLRHARAFADRRREGGGLTSINRLYAIESSPSLTGAAADHRWTMPAAEIERAARALARAVGVGLPSRKESSLFWIEAVARDLRRRRGASLVAAGPGQPSVVHALAHAMNDALGNIGVTVTALPPADFAPAAGGTIHELAEAMAAGDVRVLLILGGNPVYTAPADLNFASGMDRVALRIHLGLYENETSQLCHWHLPKAHFLESWGDARAFDGTVTIVQPTIAPLYGGRTAAEVLSAFSEEAGRSAHELVRAHWRSRHPGEEFESFWSVALHEGLVAGTGFDPVKVRPARDWAASLSSEAPSVALEAIFRPDPTIGDGRHANNAWLQELPKPLTHMTWDNAALISPALAQQLELSNGDRIELTLGGRRLEAPVWILPGHPDGSVTLPLGYGRARAGRVGSGRGFNAYALRTSGAPGFAAGLGLRKLGRKDALACTQLHYAMEGRDLIRTRAAGQPADHPPSNEDPPSLYPPVPYPGPAWGMVIDLGACTGCNACVVACQSENNIPVVGKAEVLRGREMQWIRVDRYYEGSPDNPAVHHQPVPCMHCEKAPCEPVCPVGATVHSGEGLNQMVYNRCVGTRYCQNNCPYKVRRFNFFDYASMSRGGSPSLTLLNNPDVTVRERGVMEKCTYCVQRIVGARIEAEKEGRRLRDGEVVTACAATCPSRAITFGDLNDSGSRVARLRSSPLDYALLAELNTRPRTTYLEKVINPNPELLGG